MRTDDGIRCVGARAVPGLRGGARSLRRTRRARAYGRAPLDLDRARARGDDVEAAIDTSSRLPAATTRDSRGGSCERVSFWRTFGALVLQDRRQHHLAEGRIPRTGDPGNSASVNRSSDLDQVRRLLFPGLTDGEGWARIATAIEQAADPERAARIEALAHDPLTEEDALEGRPARGIPRRTDPPAHLLERPPGRPSRPTR